MQTAGKIVGLHYSNVRHITCTESFIIRILEAGRVQDFNQRKYDTVLG